MGVDGGLPIAEVFGPTLQGEGPFAGRCASFVRFMGCNLSCSWCDTAYTWDAQRYDLRQGTQWLSVTDIIDRLPDAPIVVLTGGEPLLQQEQPAFQALIHALVDAGRSIHVETNGTQLPNMLMLSYSEAIMVSPKLPNAGEHRGHQDPALHPGFRDIAYRDNLYLKVVCENPSDVERAAHLGVINNWPRRRVWVMPQGAKPAQLDSYYWRVVAEAAAARGINATHRLHVLAWGDQRGH